MTINKSKIALATLVLGVFCLSSCVDPGFGYGYGGGPVGIGRYVSTFNNPAYSRSSSYGYRSPRGHSSSYGVQHSFGQSFRSGYGGGGFSGSRHGGRGGFSGPRFGGGGGFSGSRHGGGRH